MTSNTFRRIDIDQYNEDYYKDEEGSEPQSPPTGPDEHEILNLMNEGKNTKALKCLLKSAPLGSKNMVLKVRALELVLRVLLAIKTTDIEKTVEALTIPELDTLMKYIYAGFENPSEGRSAHLLAWHEKAYAVGGLGCIMRVLTDRNCM